MHVQLQEQYQKKTANDWGQFWDKRNVSRGGKKSPLDENYEYSEW